jgi:hypothetical protein
MAGSTKKSFASNSGYVFLINSIPMHVLALMATHRIYVTYSTLYCVDTVLSVQISFVGFQPVQASEHKLVSGRLGLYFYDFFFIFSSISGIWRVRTLPAALPGGQHQPENVEGVL